MKVRTKFKVINSVLSITGQALQDIELQAVVNGSKENEDFFKYTPSGRIALGVADTSAASLFQAGKELYVDFIDPNEEVVAAASLDTPKSFKFELGQTAFLFSSESGVIRARSESVVGEPQYLIAYKAADGRAVTDWWHESLLTAN